MLNYNEVKIAKRGRGVKDEFFSAKILGYQEKDSRDIKYNPENLDKDAILAEILKRHNASVILAQALDSVLIESAKAASDPVATMAEFILQEGKLTSDENKARQIAQTMSLQAKTLECDIMDIYESVVALKAKK